MGFACSAVVATEQLDISASPTLSKLTSPQRRTRDTAVRKLLDRRMPELVAIVERSIAEFCGRSVSDVREQGPTAPQQVLNSISILNANPSLFACRHVLSILAPFAQAVQSSPSATTEVKRNLTNVVEMLAAVLEAGASSPGFL